jgi:hypothetical protein
MTMTLLQITQEVLNDMTGDAVNSIFDTEESEQVANIVASTFRSMVSNSNWPFHRRLQELVASGNNLLPTHMILPADVKRVVAVNYNTAPIGYTRKQYKEIEWVDSDDFLRKINTRNSDNAETDVITDPSGVELLIRNDYAPSYFTSFDDTNLVFDSYDSLVDTTLQASKSQLIAFIIRTLDMADTAVPDMPEDAFAGLVEESKSRCQAKLRQFNDVKSEQEAQRQRRFMSRNVWRTKGGIKYPNYGRGTGRPRSEVTFERGKK